MAEELPVDLIPFWEEAEAAHALGWEPDDGALVWVAVPKRLWARGVVDFADEGPRGFYNVRLEGWAQRTLIHRDHVRPRLKE